MDDEQRDAIWGTRAARARFYRRRRLRRAGAVAAVLALAAVVVVVARDGLPGPLPSCSRSDTRSQAHWSWIVSGDAIVRVTSARRSGGAVIGDVRYRLHDLEVVDVVYSATWPYNGSGRRTFVPIRPGSARVAEMVGGRECNTGSWFEGAPDAMLVVLRHSGGSGRPADTEWDVVSAFADDVADLRPVGESILVGDVIGGSEVRRIRETLGVATDLEWVIALNEEAHQGGAGTGPISRVVRGD